MSDNGDRRAPVQQDLHRLCSSCAAAGSRWSFAPGSGTLAKQYVRHDHGKRGVGAGVGGQVPEPGTDALLERQVCQQRIVSTKGFTPLNCAKTVPKPGLELLCAVLKTRTGFVLLPVELCQRFTFYLQLHLRVFLEDLRVPLPEQLRDPLVRNAAGTEPSGVSRAEIVDAKISNFARRSVACQTVLNVF